MLNVGRICSLIAVVIAVYCSAANNDNMYNFIFLLPLIYAILAFIFYTLLGCKKTYKLNLVFYISQVLIFIRYVATPFFTVFSSYFTSWGWGPNPSNQTMIFAEVLMCLEMCFVFLIQYYAILKFSKKEYTRKIQVVHSSVYHEKYWLLGLYAVFACGLILLVQPNMLIMDNYFAYSASTTTSTVSMQGMYVILSETFKKVFLIIALIVCKKGYDRHNNKLFLLLAVIAVVINMALNTGKTRLLMVFSLVLGIYFLNHIFGNIPRIFYCIGFALCIVSFISVSTTKFSYALGGNVSNPVQTVISIMLGQFQDYFAGPRLVGQMIDVQKIYGNSIGLSTFINDFIGSAPVVSNFVDQTNRINYYFNIYCNMSNQTLIAPILGVGYCYFPGFPFIISMFFEYFAIKLDYLMTSTNRIAFKYLYAYMGYVCAMCMGYSTQNIYAQFISSFVPLLILFKVNDKLHIRVITHIKM